MTEIIVSQEKKTINCKLIKVSKPAEISSKTLAFTKERRSNQDTLALGPYYGSARSFTRIFWKLNTGQEGKEGGGG